MPPDDPKAHRDMHCPHDQPGYQHWHDQGDAASIESTHWKKTLNLSDKGQLQLSADRAVDLGLIHSREYQFELESLYLTALSLTLQRFEFDLQWFGGNTTDFFHFGSGGPPNEQNRVTTASSLGFSRNFAAGGQMLVNFANSFAWEFTGDDSHLAASNIAVSFVQPLLRGAFRDVRLESLTQAERNVLYAVRDFARFRKQFYVGLVSGDGGYLDLLLQLQGTRNLEQNLVALEQNLRAHEALAEAGIVSPLQVDQVFQQYQSGRLSLIRAENELQNSLDVYKIQLGLPPELPVELNDDQLQPFELTSPGIVALETQLNILLSEFRQLDESPTAEQLGDDYDELAEALDRLGDEITGVEEELERWRDKELDPLEGLEEAVDRERAAQVSMQQRLSDFQTDIRDLSKLIVDARRATSRSVDARDAELFERLARRAVNQVADLFVVQTQVRAYLIELPEVEPRETHYVQTALHERLDLANQRAVVVDNWRGIRVAADALEADLDVFLDADLGTRPGSSNPIDFSSQSSSYRVGVRWDAPLNRLAERNTYRAQLINYQQSRRAYLARRDNVVQSVRRDLRSLRTERLNFEISRQSLVAAARQVELARLQLLAPDQEGDSSTTQDALNSLNSMLDAKNSLISSWVAYETARLQLLLDTESFQIDPQGQVRDDSRPFKSTESADEEPHSADQSSDYFGPGDAEELPPPVHF